MGWPLWSLLVSRLLHLMRGFAPPRQDRFHGSTNGHQTLRRETRIQQQDYKLQSAQHYNHKYKCSFIKCAQLNHTINVLKYKNPRTRPYPVPIMRWHDRWRPHASQWPELAYHAALAKLQQAIGDATQQTDQLVWAIANTQH